MPSTSSLASSIALISLTILAHFHATLANFSPYPSALWTGVNPTTVTYNANTSLLYITTYYAILATTPADPTTVLANATLPTAPSTAADSPISCGGYVHQTVNDGELGHAWLYTWNATTLEVVRNYQLPYQQVAMACVGNGEVLLTGRASGSIITAIRASDAERLAVWQLSGMHVRDCALSEANEALYVLDDTYHNSSIQVFSYSTGTHLHTFSLPNVTAVFTITIDPTSTFLYVQCVLDQSQSESLLQLRIGDGRLEVLTFPYSQYEPNDGVAVLSATRALIGDHLSFSLLAVDFTTGPQSYNVTHLPVGPRPLLESVTGLAVDGESYLYVASGWPALVWELDGMEGRLIATYELNDGAACEDRRRVAVAVDNKRQVYVTLCDGRIGVYDQQQQFVDYALPLNYSAATTMINALYVSRNTSQLLLHRCSLPALRLPLRSYTARGGADMEQRVVAVRVFSRRRARSVCVRVQQQRQRPNHRTLRCQRHPSLFHSAP